MERNAAISEMAISKIAISEISSRDDHLSADRVEGDASVERRRPIRALYLAVPSALDRRGRRGMVFLARFARFAAIAMLLCGVLYDAATPEVLAAPSGAGSGTGQGGPTGDQMLDKLRDRAVALGRVPVIVRLSVPELEGGLLLGDLVDELDRGAIRRSAIARAQDGLLDDLRPFRARSLKRFEHIPFIAVIVDARELEDLVAHPDVVAVVEDRLNFPDLKISVPFIGADIAAAVGYDGAGQAVAVLDTGVDSLHAFLAGKVLAEACFSTDEPGLSTTLCPNGQESDTGPGAGAPCTGFSTCDHGTHVAGIAVSADVEYAGVAPGADLIAVQVFSRIEAAIPGCSSPPCLAAFDSDIVLGLEHVLSLNGTLPAEIASVNMSLGGPAFNSAKECDTDPQTGLDSATKVAIDNLRAAGIVTAISSGNGGLDGAIGSPVASPAPPRSAPSTRTPMS